METNADIHMQLVDVLSHWQQPWEGTPEDFYVFVIFFHAYSNMEVLAKDLSDPVNRQLRDEFEAVADNFMKIFKVDLSPWASFGDMIDNGDFRDLLIEAATKFKATINEMSVLQEVTEDGTIQLSRESQVEASATEMLADILAKRARIFFRFKGQA